jgi:predicted metal-dependent phosphotriesterase family hydrolase
MIDREHQRLSVSRQCRLLAVSRSTVYQRNTLYTTSRFVQPTGATTLATREVLEFKKAGGGTIVEVSSIGVGRSPASIRSVAMLTGVNVVLGCGYYTKYALPQEVVDESEAILTENLINEIQYGIGVSKFYSFSRGSK